MGAITIDDLFTTSPLGSIDRAIGNNLFGINHCQTPGMVPTARSSKGFLFFTRPQLNFQPDNLRAVRRMYKLLSETDGMAKFVTATLDPRRQQQYTVINKPNNFLIPPIQTNLVDPLQAFIPVMTNDLISANGWPDETLGTFSSKEGNGKEVYIQADGVKSTYGRYSINCTFRNTVGRPILNLMLYWQLYCEYVGARGLMLPYPDFLLNNEKDYETRIYRITLDSNRRKVDQIAYTGASIPVTIPTGDFFNFDAADATMSGVDSLNVEFVSANVSTNDDIGIYAFNEAVCYFNPSMRDNVRESKMSLIHPAYLQLFNNRGYPRINIRNNNFEWWIDTAYYNTRMAHYKSLGVKSIYNPDTDMGSNI